MITSLGPGPRAPPARTVVCGGRRTPPHGARAVALRHAGTGASGPPQRMRMSRARLLRPPHADPPTTNRLWASAPYWQVPRRSWCELRGRRDELPTPANPPHQSPGWPDRGLCSARLVGQTTCPLPDTPSHHAPGRPGLGTARSSARGGEPHRTTQPHFAAVLSEDLVGFDSQGQPT